MEELKAKNQTCTQQNEQALQAHYEGCWAMPRHHECAKVLIETLANDVDRLQKEIVLLQADIGFWKRQYSDAKQYFLSITGKGAWG